MQMVFLRQNVLAFYRKCSYTCVRCTQRQYYKAGSGVMYAKLKHRSCQFVKSCAMLQHCLRQSSFIFFKCWHRVTFYFNFFNSNLLCAANNGYIFLITFKRFHDINVMGSNMLRWQRLKREGLLYVNDSIMIIQLHFLLYICQRFHDDYTITITLFIIICQQFHDEIKLYNIGSWSRYY